MKRLIIFLFLALLSLSSHARDRYFLSERVYVAPLNNVVYASDTVRLMGQVLSTDYGDFYPYSRYVYVELSDRNNALAKRVKVRCNDDGSFYAAMPLDGEMAQGVYNLRGYTQFMRNRGNDFYPMTPLYVGVRPVADGDTSCVSAMFFPEGGHFVSGEPQTMGVYLCNATLSPVSAEFDVVRGNGEVVCGGKTSSSGLASVSFMPDGDDCMLVVKGGEGVRRFVLPAAMDAPTLRVTQNRGRVVCRVLCGESTRGRADSCRVYMYHSGFGIKTLAMRDGAGMADVGGCTPGLLTLWLVDGDGNVLSQRVLWTGDGGTIPSSGGISIATNGCQGDALHVTLNDSVPSGRVFVRFLPEGSRNVHTAMEMLQYRSEAFSPVPFPLSAVTDSGAEQSRGDIDTWLLSASQTMVGRDVLNADSIAYAYPVEAAPCVSGTVRNGRKPLDGASVQIYNTLTNDATIAYTDSTGHFEAVTGDFLDGTSLYVQAYNKKGKTSIYSYTLDDDDFPSIQSFSALSMLAREVRGVDMVPNSPSMEETVNTLAEVQVRKRRPQSYDWARIRDPFCYFDRKFLDEHHCIFTVKDAILYTGKVLVTDNDNNIMWKSRKLQGLMPPGIPGDRNNKSEIAIVMNGMAFDRDLSDILGMVITGIESIELVPPLDVRCMWYDTVQGFFEIKFAPQFKASSIVSNGVTIQPMGVVPPLQAFDCHLPEKEGRYRMVVDVVAADRSIRSFVKDIEVRAHR